MTYDTSTKFISGCLANLSGYKVSAQARVHLRSILANLREATEELGDFERENPQLDLVSACNQLCPHCGSQLQRIGWTTCSSCSKEIAWAFTRELKYAGYTTEHGHTYGRTIGGACTPNNLSRLQGYFALSASVAELEREFIVTKEASEKEYKWCFVATATFGDQNHPTVEYFRSFRDNVLRRWRSGQLFVDWYYANGEQLSRVVYMCPLLRPLLKFLFNALYLALKMYVYRPSDFDNNRSLREKSSRPD